MKSHLAALLAAFAVVAPSANAQPVAPDFSAARLSEHIRILASDEFEGRAPTTVGERKTIEYLIAAYREMGLEPAGPNGSWVQPVDLVRFTPDNTAARISYGFGLTNTLKFGADFTGSVLDPTGRASVVDGDLVYVGYGISAPERGWDDLAGLDLAGKTVVYLRGEPDDGQKTGPFDGEALTLFGRTTHKWEEFARRGARGAIQLSASNADSEAWKERVSQAGQPEFDIAAAPGERRLGYAVAFNAEAGQALMSAGGLNPETFRAEARKAGFKGRPLAGLRLSLSLSGAIAPIRTYNVLARVKGRTHPTETVLFTAHWDHIGKADAPDAKGDMIYNGAWDNASGTAAILEMARAFAKGPRPDRSIVFINFTAEEAGLLGSEYYTEHPVWPLETTAALFDIDMPPIMGRTRDIEIMGFGKSDLEDSLAAAAARRGMVIVPDSDPAEGYYYRSDHFPFAQKGVPALMTASGKDLLDGGKEAGAKEMERMLEAYYHKRADEWRPDMKLDGTVDLLDLYYEIAGDLASSRRWPQWKPAAEFKPIRDVSAGRRN